MSRDIYVKLAGELVPLSACDWVMFKSCGCARGVTMAQTEYTTVATEDEAWTQFFGTKRSREEQQKKHGLLMELMTHADFVAGRFMQLECPHEKAA